MRLYVVKKGTTGILLTHNGERVLINTCEFNNEQVLDETDVLDSPSMEQLGTSKEIDDPDFSIVREFAKHGYYVFQKWAGDGSKKNVNRMVVVVLQNDVKTVMEDSIEEDDHNA